MSEQKGISIADLCRSTSRVLDTRAPSRQWNGHASIDLRRAAREIDRLEAALRIIAGEAPSPDNLLGNADIARIALHGKLPAPPDAHSPLPRANLTD